MWMDIEDLNFDTLKPSNDAAKGKNEIEVTGDQCWIDLHKDVAEKIGGEHMPHGPIFKPSTYSRKERQPRKGRHS